MRSRLPAALLAIPWVASAAAQEPTPAQVDWLRKNAVVLKTVEAGKGFDDLQPLKQLVGDARIVALGEPTHGSHEVFQMKHRLLEFLVLEMGFSVFSIEANMPESFRVGEYVLGGEGDVDALIRGMYFWTWQTLEVREMVQWMRAHNARVDKEKTGARVRFTGFDVQTAGVAAEIVGRYVEKADPELAPAVREAANAALSAARAGASFGTATATFPFERARDKRLVYRGWIRTENVEDGHAGLWWRCDVGSEPRGLDNMRDRGPRGTSDWQRFEIAMDVPAETTNINFGAMLAGRGKAWFDGLEITLDGQPVALPGLDLDFEGERHEGFRAPASGYQARLDRAVVKLGAQSLRIEGRSTADDAKPPDKAAATWQRVVSRLEQRRARLIGQEADLVALDWAIVNARLVKDAMDVKAGNRTARDQAMARMVAWILEQSPKARIVLWAHNGHVAREPGWMGRHLEDMFPGQMVVLGFATGDGSYRAVSRSGKGITEHGLMRPATDSFERVFQAAGLPVAIFDLRKAVKGSPESGFLLEKRRLRSIGAMEMPDLQFFPTRLRDSFDAVVWIEKTRASLPLAR